MLHAGQRPLKKHALSVRRTRAVTDFLQTTSVFQLLTTT
jgi:outer membrane protein OmpA-like peptidoglycan-associated protein